MRYIMLLLVAGGLSVAIAQKSAPLTLPVLPAKTYTILRDSTTSMDVVIMQGKGSSLSLDGRNVLLFNSFFENKPTPKFNAPLGGTIMWQINGREFISGRYYLGDSTGYVDLAKNNKEYVILLNGQGNKFLKSQIKN